MAWAAVKYREHAPPAQLAGTVECLWTLQSENASDWLVLPDGCCDIVFTPGANLPQVVGTMTRAHRFSLAAGHAAAGVRFRPAAGAAVLGVRGSELTDAVLPLEQVWGARGRRVAQQLGEALSAEATLKVLAQAASAFTPPNHAVSKALAWAAGHAEEAGAELLAHKAGASIRHFRRLCLEQSGVSPKMICRILRLRRAVSAIHAGRAAYAQLAAECGYFDQAHMIREFRDLAGCTPSEYRDFANGRFFQSPAQPDEYHDRHEDHSCVVR